jgi:hypothetical protein
MFGKSKNHRVVSIQEAVKYLRLTVDKCVKEGDISKSFYKLLQGFFHKDKTEEYLIGIREVIVSLKAQKSKLKKEIAEKLSKLLKSL